MSTIEPCLPESTLSAIHPFIAIAVSDRNDRLWDTGDPARMAEMGREAVIDGFA